MADAEARTGLLTGQRTFGSTSNTENTPSESRPIYYDTQLSPTAKMLQLSFMVMVVLMVLVSFILSIYRSASQGEGLYVLLGLGLVGFLAINVILIMFIRYGDLSPEKSWFLYMVGGCIIVESILTSILLFKV